MQKLAKFLTDSELGMRCREVDRSACRTLPVTSAWAAKQYRCELHGTNGDRPITTIIGSDNGPPELLEVVDEVAAEAAVVDATGCFEAWAAEMGFDSDSRRAERVYRAWRRKAIGLRKLLGDEQYQQLLWRTERL